MSGGSQIKTTITTAVTRTEMSHIHDTAYDKDSSQDRNGPKVTNDDASNTEQLKGRGDVKRKIIELENAKNIMPTSAIGKQKSLAEIGEKISAVKEVVKDFEDKLHDYSVETIPFKVRQRDPTPAHVDESVLERQILTDVDLALENLISHEPPAAEVKLSPVTAIETRLDNSDVPKEEICEKVCMKRKMFEVAKDETKSATKDEAESAFEHPMEKSPKAINLPSADSEDSGILPNVKDVVKTFEQKFASLQSSPLPARKQVVLANNEVDITYLGEQGLSQTDEIIAGSALPEHGAISTQARLDSSLGKEQVEQFSDPLVKKRKMSEINRDYDTSLIDQNTPNDNKKEVVSKVTDEPQVANNANDFIETICDKTEFPIEGTNVIDNSCFPMTDKEGADLTPDKHDTDTTSIKEYKLKIYETVENERKLEVCLGNLKQRKDSIENVKSSDETSTIKRFPVTLPLPISEKNESKEGINKIESSSKNEQDNISCEDLNINQLKLKTFSGPPVPLITTKNIEWTDEKIKRLETSDPHILPKQKDFRITSERKEVMTTEEYISSEHQNKIFHHKAITKEYTDNKLDEKIEHKINFRVQTNTIKDQTALLPTHSTNENKPEDTVFKDVQPDEKHKFSLDIAKPVSQVYYSEEIEEDYDKHMVTDMKKVFPLVPSVGKPDDKDTKDVQPISKPTDKPKSPLDIAKSVPHVYSSDESEDEFDKPKFADMKQALSLVSSVGKPDDKDTKDVQPISKPEDKPKSPLDIAKSVPHVYSSDESEEEFDKPKASDMKQVFSLEPSVGKPDDKDTKDVQPISKPKDKPKSPLDIAKSVPHVYSSDESEEELDKPKVADMKQALPLVPSVGKPDDKDTKDVQPISKPTDKPKSPLDIAKPVPHVYSSDESEEELDKPKLADMKQALPLVPSVGKPDDKDTKDVQPISKPTDKPKSPLDITKPVPHVYSSDESEEELDKPKLADMKQALPLVPSVGKPDDKDTKDVQPISKPTDKPKSPLDITKPVPHVYSSDESEEELDKPKLADMKQALPLVPSVGKPDDKDTKDVQPISKPTDKPKSPLDITKPVPHVYSSDESEEELDKPKLADMKQALPLVPSVGKPDDKDTKDVQPISKPTDKPKSPLDITKPVPHVYSSDESEEELDKPKLADMKQALPLVPSVGKPDDKGAKDVQPISKPTDKPKSPLDIAKPVPHVYSSDESQEDFDKPKLADMKQALPLVPSVGKPDDKDTKDVQPISKPTDKPKSPLDITKPVPHVYSSDESEEELDKPKLADMKQALPLVPSVGKPDDKDTKDVQPISKPEDKPKSPLDITKPVPHVYSSDESEDEFDKPKLADMKQALPLVPSVGKPDDKDTKDVQPISKPTDKPKSPLDITKPVPHVYSSDESEEELDKPKLADMKQALPLVPSVGKPDDKDTKDVQPISKPTDKPKSPLDITKPVPHVYSSDESEEELDKPKLADMKQALPVVPSVGKPDDKDTKDVQPISKPTDKPKSPLDITKPVPHVYSSDESDEDFDKPKPADMKQALPLVSSVGKPDDKDTKEVQPISKPTDKPKSPLDITKPVPHVYSSDESEDEFDKPKPADMKQALPLVSSVGKPDDKDTKDVQPISKPTDKPKSPLDITKPVPHVYSSDESEEELDKPKLADMKQALPLVPSVGKPDDKDTKDVQPISKPTDKPKSPLDITKPVPHVYSSDESDEDFDKPKPADMKQALPLVSSVGKPDDKDTKEVQPISKPTDKPKSPLDITKPVPHVYSSDESEEELDKPKLADMKQALPLVPSVGKPDDKDTKDIQPISKPTDKPKSPLDITKPVPHVYSSDESDEDFDKPKLRKSLTNLDSLI
ncbi:microtubule-associated protein futsch-like [Bactrocera dorsalis]|uniref:Microtubule-associated protein futsch-like n=1 Tax=Bactrocera dorsalis TaxID=27457 RepID=A0ABM3JWT8_BACDO|nr:microtubule-associated protein futsch-like [Bactrocera dorsalis]